MSGTFAGAWSTPTIAAAQLAEAAPDDGADLAEVQLRREEVGRRHGHQREEPVDLARRGGQELAVEPHDLGRLLERPERRSRDHRRDRMCLEEERGDDAEV